MTASLHGLFEGEIARLTQLLGGRADHARFLFDDLAGEAAHAAQAHGAPYCLALRAAIIAFEVDFAQSHDVAVAHTAAVARLEVMALLSGRGR